VIKLRPQHETKLQISREVRDFGEFVRVENSYDYRLLQKNSREVVVGVERFELPTSCSQSLQQGKTGILGNCVFATFSKNIKH